nr:signal peptide peptidase SppA [Bacteroides sp.]
MKNFLNSFLGTLAGIWVTIFILGAIMIFSLVVAAVSGTSGSGVSVKDHSVLYIDLNDNITECRERRNLISELQGEVTGSMPLNELTAVIRRAAYDDHIQGIFIDCNGASAGMAQREAINAALKAFKKESPDKWIYAYGDTYTQGDYYTACAADSIFINPSGMIDIHGLSSTALYFKGLMDKLGVNMQVVKVGTYKSAVEPYIMDGPSEPSVEQQTLFLNNIWASIRKTIAEARHTSPDTVNSWANSLMMAKDVDFYLSARIADGKMYRHEFLDKLKKLTGRDKLRLVSVKDYAGAVDLDLDRGHSTTIAVYYASGEIFDKGEQGITAEKMVDDLLDLADNDKIDGLILRVNSPGGSAFASEQIWEAVEQFKEITGKPVYVSMSDYAASGGYYISCGADRIYAEPLTLTGSIGIFGLIPDAHGLITDKLGVTTHTIATNPDGDLPSLFKPMTPVQQTQMQAYVNRGYELFVKRVADGRHMPVDSVKMIAEGRVWDGAEAMKRGLVDKLGGLDAALRDMAKSLNAADYNIVEYPDYNAEWWEMFLDIKAQAEANAVRKHLGDANTLYETLRRFNLMAPVQARMDYVTVNM